MLAQSPLAPMSKRSRLSSGSSGFARTAQPGSLHALPGGPSTTAEVFTWPSDMVSRLFSGDGSAERKCRLLGNSAATQWLITSDYSGFDCPREALRVGHIALRQHLQLDAMPAPRFLRSCDIDKLPQAALLHYAHVCDAGMSCLFADINDRLSDSARAALDMMEPARMADKSQSLQARQDQLNWLQAHLEEEFGPRATSYCLVHEQQCEALPNVAPQAVDPLSCGVGQMTALRVNIAGTCCQGWSSQGLQWRGAHPSERAHSVWLCERLAAAKNGLEDLFIHECTPGYDFQKLVTALNGTHSLFRIVLSPRQLGHPVQRARAFSFGVSKKTLCWLGPEDPDDIQKDFDALFHRRLMCSADVFMNASKDEANAELRRMAAAQKN